MKIIPPPACNRALTRVELCVVIAVITACAIFFLSVPDRNVRARALRVQCLNNLKRVGIAFDVWASDHGEKFPMEISQTNGGTMEFSTGPNEWRHFQILSNELFTPRVLLCPADDSHVVGATNFSFFKNSNLSFFVNLDYSRPDPHALWCGDRNITNGRPLRDGVLELTTNPPAAWTTEMHKKAGNLLLFDGSVLRADQGGLRNAIANSGTFTNRLQMPVTSP
jgi:hypothetical protein